MPPLLDRTAIGLSLLCTLHCLVVPVVLAMGPALATLPIFDERVHRWLVVLALPTSAIGLFLGCRKHRHGSIAVQGAAGLALLVGAVVAGHELLGESGERSITVLGALLLASSHVRNFLLCRSSECAEEGTCE